MKHTIEIEGLPNDVIPMALRKPKSNKEFIFCFDTGRVVQADHRIPKVQLIVKKKQPRRIVLEEVNTVEYDLLIDNVTYNIVEDSGENDD